METSAFSPVLALREAGSILEASPANPYLPIAKLLQNFRLDVRNEAAAAICSKFKLDPAALDRERLFIAEEQCETETVTESALSFVKYVEQIEAEKERIPNTDWRTFNGATYTTPDQVMMACIYEMVRHLAWKFTASGDDIALAALVDKAWENAQNERLRN